MISPFQPVSIEEINYLSGSGCCTLYRVLRETNPLILPFTYAVGDDLDGIASRVTTNCRMVSRTRVRTRRGVIEKR
jgi:hypothetical protein